MYGELCEGKLMGNVRSLILLQAVSSIKAQRINLRDKVKDKTVGTW
jgi:hypothetical protein